MLEFIVENQGPIATIVGLVVAEVITMLVPTAKPAGLTQRLGELITGFLMKVKIPNKTK